MDSPFIEVQRFIKRMIDITGAGAGLLLLGPFMVGIGILIRLESKGSPIFKQKRAGLNGKAFTLYKFRTMLTEEDAKEKGIEPNDEIKRITKVGAFLRNTSLDELPQLINVLKGEMSLVGPRALLLRYVDRYSSEQRKRLLVKPGITGLAQIRGRNALTWEEKFSYDIEYVKNWSLWLDIRILFETLAMVIRRKGIYSQEGIMPEFMGSEDK